MLSAELQAYKPILRNKKMHSSGAFFVYVLLYEATNIGHGCSDARIGETDTTVVQKKRVVG